MAGPRVFGGFLGSFDAVLGRISPDSLCDEEAFPSRHNATAWLTALPPQQVLGGSLGIS